MSQEDYDSLMETMEIMRRRDFVDDIIVGAAEDRADEGVAGDELRQPMEVLRGRQDG